MRMNIQKQFNAASIFIIVLGFIHIAATPVILPMFKILGEMGLLTFAFMYVATGIATMFAGWLQNYLIRREINRTNLYVIKFSILFVFILGLGATITMWDNPFAYISLLVALYEFILLKRLKKIIK
jgi:hypothetical protein